MSSETEKVTVRIEWSERVQYESEVTMNRSDYERFQELWNDDDESDQDIERFLALVDRMDDAIDSDHIEIDCFDVVAPTENKEGM